MNHPAGQAETTRWCGVVVAPRGHTPGKNRGATRAARPERSNPPMAPTAKEQPRAVVISEAHGFAHLLQALLNDLGLAVRTTGVREGAAQVVEHSRPDLVILDIVPSHES